MTYEEFEIEYNKLLGNMLSYSPSQAGSSHYAEKLGELVDAYPEHSNKLDGSYA